MGIKEARHQTKQRTMINHNTTYEAGTPELASGFLLMPCYMLAAVHQHKAHLETETFFIKTF